jgi:hypothetical protein
MSLTKCEKSFLPLDSHVHGVMMSDGLLEQVVLSGIWIPIWFQWSGIARRRHRLSIWCVTEYRVDLALNPKIKISPFKRVRCSRHKNIRLIWRKRSTGLYRHKKRQYVRKRNIK